MPYALVPIIDVGPSPYRPGLQRRMPLGLDQGGNCIHLGPDNALIWTPAAIADARAQTLADDRAETLTAARLTTLTTLAAMAGRSRWASASFIRSCGACW